MILSPFTPLFFPSAKADGIESAYIQTFAPADKILIELIGEKTWYGIASVIDINSSASFQIQFNFWDITESTRLRFAALSLSPGFYQVSIMGIGRSAVFRVTDDADILDNTTLIQYSNKDNRSRHDVISWIDGMQHFFDFRVPGGFKDSNWTFGVESEQFVTEDSDIIQLYGLESTQMKFTLGTSEGCPVWFAELLNRLLTCDYVYFDGVRFARKEASVPETNAVQEGVNSFVFTQNLQKVVNIDPKLTLEHQAIMRRIDSTNYRAVNETNNRLIK